MAATENSEQDARAVRTEAHTPTPWNYRPTEGQTAARICDASGQKIAVVIPEFYPPEGDMEQAEANAAFIVRAVNAHDDLVKALELARECITYCRRTHKDAQSGSGFPVEMILDAALIRAKGAA